MHRPGRSLNDLVADVAGNIAGLFFHIGRVLGIEVENLGQFVVPTAISVPKPACIAGKQDITYSASNGDNDAPGDFAMFLPIDVGLQRVRTWTENIASLAVKDIVDVGAVLDVTAAFREEIRAKINHGT
jgi:hypothetical protein